MSLLSASDIAKLIRDAGDRTQDRVLVLFGDKDGRYMSQTYLASHTDPNELVSRREIFRECVRREAAGFVVVVDHRDPFVACRPRDDMFSGSDMQTAVSMIYSASRILGFRMIDLVIYRDRKIYSARRNGLCR